jgi:hypothetical protein
MQTSQTSTGHKLKQAITANEQENAYNEAVKAVRDFKAAHNQEDIGIMEEVSFFLGGELASDNIFDYHFSTQLLVEALAKPDVNDFIRQYIPRQHLNNLVEMFGQLIHFFKGLDNEYNLLLLEEYQLTRNSTHHHKSAEEWHEIAETYQRRLMAFKIKNGIE